MLIINRHPSDWFLMANRQDCFLVVHVLSITSEVALRDPQPLFCGLCNMSSEDACSVYTEDRHMDMISLSGHLATRSALSTEDYDIFREISCRAIRAQNVHDSICLQSTLQERGYKNDQVYLTSSHVRRLKPPDLGDARLDEIFYQVEFGKQRGLQDILGSSVHALPRLDRFFCYHIRTVTM